MRVWLLLISFVLPSLATLLADIILLLLDSYYLLKNEIWPIPAAPDDGAVFEGTSTILEAYSDAVAFDAD